MRKVSHVLALFFVVILCACSKENITVRSLQGKWQFVYGVGGFSGSDTIQPPRDTTVIFAFNSDNTYQQLSNEEVVHRGHYAIRNVHSIYTNEEAPALFLDDGSAGKIITVTGKTLSLQDNHYEPFTYLYIRVYF